jgi:transcriptional regulator with XRE-family HTH domain
MRLTEEDREETRKLRLARVEEKRTVKQLNHVGKRITWCRETLEMTQRNVCEATGIPPSSYCGREGGIRTDFIEEFLVLAVFFDREWQRKFSSPYPYFNGQEVRKITPSWLMYGSDELAKNAELLIQEFKIKLQEIEHEHWQREAEMKRQLSMFAEEEL